MVYQPMLELLAFLRQNGFRTFIVSGGGIDFMRPWTEEVYGIPPEQVVGSRVKKSFEIRDGQPVVVRLPEMDFVDDKEGKPVGIQTHIGRRPILAVGNSDGDFEMLQWTTAGAGSRMAIYIHHTDSEREVAYDRDSAIGRLDRGLDEGKRLGWTFVDMKADWATIYPEVQPQDSGEPSKAESLIGKWLAEDIEGRGVVDRAQSTLEIAEDGGVSGSTAVNQYFGKATVTDGSIRFGPLGSTLRAGSPALMDQERRFTTALGKVARFRTSSQGMLYLLDGSGKELIKFSRMDD